jgi:hypothetical protein
MYGNKKEPYPPSSPVKSDKKSDLHLQLKKYLTWSLQRAGKRRDIFFKATIAFTDGGYEIGDIRNIEKKEWKNLGILSGISKALQRKVKYWLKEIYPFQLYNMLDVRPHPIT